MNRPVTDSKKPSPATTGATSLPHGPLAAIAVLILSVAGAIAYAGQAAVEVAYRLIVDGGIVVAWLASAAGWGSAIVTWACAAGRSGIDAPPVHEEFASTVHSRTIATVTAIALGLGMVGLIVLATGLIGILSRATSIVLLAAGLLPGAWQLRRRRATAPASSVSSSRWNWLWLLAVPMASMALVAAFVPPGLLWKPHEPHGYDVVEYHFQLPREWYDAGRILPTPHNAFGSFPFGVEMHYLLAMHLRGGPWDGMYLAQLMHLAMIALSVIATCGFAGQLAADRRIAAIVSTVGAIMGATVPWLAQLAPIGFNEGGLLLFGTLAIGWTITAMASSRHGPGEGSYRGRRPLGLRAWIIAGLCAGLACGVKLTAAPLLLLAIPLVAVGVALISPARERRAICRSVVIGAALFVAIGMAAFAPWLVRNAVWAGNPVFPEGREVFGNGPFSEMQAERWQAAHAARPDQQSLGVRLSAIGSEVIANSQFGYVLLPTGLIALAIGWRSPVSRLLAGLLIVLTLFWLGFTHLQGRFFVLAIPVAVLAVAAAGGEIGRQLPARATPIVLGVLIAVAAAATFRNWLSVHKPLTEKLYRDQGTGVLVTLGNEDVSWITHTSLEGFPLSDPAVRLVLVGDAQAFWYPLDRSRLCYRTVFDLDAARPLLDAFDPEGWRHDGQTWLLIVPSEIERYARTYRHLPAVPDHWRGSPAWQNGLPFLVRPADIDWWETVAAPQ